MRHKIELNRTKKQREEAVSIVVERLNEDPLIKLSNVALRKKAESNQTIIEIDLRIEGLCLLIEYLEKAEKIINGMTWDLKNIIDIVKIETQ